MQLFIDTIGWVGSFAVLAAYALVSSKRLEATSMRYQGLNLVGAIGLAANTVFYTAYPSVLLNVVWGIIAIGAIYRYWPSRRAAAAR